MKHRYIIAATICLLSCALGTTVVHGVPKEVSAHFLSGRDDWSTVFIALAILSYGTQVYTLSTLKRLLVDDLDVFGVNGYINVSLIISLVLTIFTAMMIRDPMQIVLKPMSWMGLHFTCGVSGAVTLMIGLSLLRNPLVAWPQLRLFSASMILASIPSFLMSTVPFLMMANTPDRLKISMKEYIQVLSKVLSEYHYAIVFESFRALSMLTTVALALVFIRAAQSSRPRSVTPLQG